MAPRRPGDPAVLIALVRPDPGRAAAGGPARSLTDMVADAWTFAAGPSRCPLKPGLPRAAGLIGPASATVTVPKPRGCRGPVHPAVRREPRGTWQAPGRVNLIGEHTDYNDGFVLPVRDRRRADRRRRRGATTACSRWPRGRPPASDVAVPLDGLAPGLGRRAGRPTRPGWPGRCATAGYPVDGAEHRLSTATSRSAPGCPPRPRWSARSALTLTDLHGLALPRAAARRDRAPGRERLRRRARPGSWTSRPRCSARPGTRCCSTAAAASAPRCRSTRRRRAWPCW